MKSQFHRRSKSALGTLLILTAALGATAAERPVGPLTDEGDLAGAAYRIEIPEGWNGGLLMYAHGYEAVSDERRGFNTTIVESAHALGLAVAQSIYSAQGWAAREGVLDTETLRRYFVAKYGPTSPTYIAGHSQGAAITFETIERFPEVYDGALPMCGTSEPALKFMKERVFDMRLLFDYFFPGLPGSVIEFPGGREIAGNVAAKAEELIGANPEQAEAFIALVDLPSIESIAGVIAFWSEILRELTERAGGNAFDNRGTVYSGTDDDAKLNREIKRYAADAKAVEYLREWVTPTGDISDPVIMLHTLVDQLVPATSTKYYEQLTRVAGTADQVISLWVDRPGHCAFNVEEMTEALRRLDRWAREGKRPEAGEITATK